MLSAVAGILILGASEAIPHHTYVGPFVGMGGIFLRRSRPSPAEVINDLSEDVANLFRVVRQHYQAFVDEFAFLPASHDEFDRQRRLDPAALADIDRAVRILCLQRLCLGGRVEGRSFGVRKDQSSRIEGYGIAFDRDQYVAMAAQLAGIAGRFVLSINGTRFVRKTFAAFDI